MSSAAEHSRTRTTSGDGAAGHDVVDVIIIGGGPVGSTASCLLKKYNPDLSVLVVEKEKFPREHVGESQLPSIGVILEEMGAWDKVEGADFPIKIGASLTWGATGEPWDFDFFPAEMFDEDQRPGRFEGQRRQTAFQVERAIYDDILLRHAESMGVDVLEEVKVDEVCRDGDRITGLRLSNGRTVTGRYYVDGSGAAGLLRRAMGVESDAPQELRNIAIYDYWENAEWAVKIGAGATRVFVRSLPYGWIWFIPLGPTRTSIGLICPSAYYKAQGKTPAELYETALADEKTIAGLIAKATPRGELQTCKDWSHVAHRLVGDNWFLAGEAAGFADPILAAGLTLAHGSAREVAYTILELERGEVDADWLRRRYDERNRNAIRQHIRFAQYWYSANGCFSDLQEHCAAIAKEAGARLSPAQAWRWLAQGGFVNHDIRLPQLGSFDVFSAREIIERFHGGESRYAVESFNVLKLNLHGTGTEWVGHLEDGRIHRIECHVKGNKRLPKSGFFGNVIAALEQTSDAVTLMRALEANIAAHVPPDLRGRAMQNHMEVLETMILDGWVITRRDRKRPMITASHGAGLQIRSSAEGAEALHKAQASRGEAG